MQSCKLKQLSKKLKGTNELINEFILKNLNDT